MVKFGNSVMKGVGVNNKNIKSNKIRLLDSKENRKRKKKKKKGGQVWPCVWEY